jgi:hypothetical protein
LFVLGARAMVARDDAELRASLVSSLQEVRGPPLGSPCPSRPRTPNSLLSLGIGLGILRALDPSISAQLITDGLRMLLMLAGATFQTAMPGSS